MDNMEIKEPTLTSEQINKFIENLYVKYVDVTEKCIEDRECPPNIYKFCAENFRPIEGHDTEWYKVFEGWKYLLAQRKRWHTHWRRSNETMEGIMDYQYCYKERLNWVPPIAPIQMSEDGLTITDSRILKFMDDMRGSMDGSKCSQFLG